MKVGRFQVMATLQAARASELGFSESRAKSWRLNRAIFYAAAKRGFKQRLQPLGRRRVYHLGDEMAYAARKSGRVYFTIGGKLQTEADFKGQIESRFGKRFPAAWKEALRIVRQYPKDVLLSRSQFFNSVYHPRRDELAAKWTETSE